MIRGNKVINELQKKTGHFQEIRCLFESGDALICCWALWTLKGPQAGGRVEKEHGVDESRKCPRTTQHHGTAVQQSSGPSVSVGISSRNPRRYRYPHACYKLYIIWFMITFNYNKNWIIICNELASEKHPLQGLLR